MTIIILYNKLRKKDKNWYQQEEYINQIHINKIKLTVLGTI